MKNTKLAKNLSAALACACMMTAIAPSESLSASAAEYKIFKEDMTVEWYGEKWNHDDFQAVWMSIYETFGADVTIQLVKMYTCSPHSEEWVRVGGPEHFADCWFQLHWWAANDMMDQKHRYYLGEGWRAPEGWRDGCPY